MSFTVDMKDIIAILSIVFGGGSAGVLTLKSKGLITFGKPVERRKDTLMCAGHNQMHEDILNLGKEIKNLNIALNTLNIKMERHIGYHEGKNT